MEQRYQQLARRMVLTALAVALIPLYLVGGGIFLYYSSVHRLNQETELRNIVASRASAVQLFLAERTAMLEALVHTATVEQLARPGELASILRLLNRRSSSFLDLGVIDSEGNHIAYVGPYALEDQKYGDAPWFLETMARGVYVSDVFLGVRQVPHFVVAVKSQDAEEVWILRATIDSAVFTRLVRSAQLGMSGDAYIVNRSGQYQTPPRFGGGLLSTAPFDPEIAPPGTSVIQRTTSDGRDLLSAFTWLAGKEWLLVIDRDPRETRGPLVLARHLELLTLAAATLLIAGAVVFHVRLMVRELESQERTRLALEAQLAHSGRLASLGRMAAGVAHEINNPLAAIGELSGLMGDLIDEEFRASTPHAQLFVDNIRKIEEHVERARSVTHRLLGFARRMEPRHDTLDLNQVVEEALTFIDREASLRGVRLTRQLDPTMPQITSDRAQLQQVILNLVNNALDAVADEGGHIVVRTRTLDDTVEVAIDDNGCGIPRELHERIFDPFFTTKSPGKGTGLGLSISHTIVQQLGGSLAFDSEPGEGTTFQVRLPRRRLE
jgi:two-component system NtrC family sensor kinase